jgi:hypothetical protein
MHLIVMHLPDFKDELEVLLCEPIFNLLGLLLLIFLVGDLFGVLIGSHFVFLYLSYQGDFLLHHITTISVVEVLWIEFWRGQETGGQRNAHARRWHFLLN